MFHLSTFPVLNHGGAGSDTEACIAHSSQCGSRRVGAKFVSQFVFIHSVALVSVMFLVFDAQSVFKPIESVLFLGFGFADIRRKLFSLLRIECAHRTNKNAETSHKHFWISGQQMRRSTCPRF